jgi:deoxycytidine triphosphate deaminase
MGHYLGDFDLREAGGESHSCDYKAREQALLRSPDYINLPPAIAQICRSPASKLYLPVLCVLK